MIIEAGYWLKVTSWENDADNYRTGEIRGLDAPEVQVILKFCNLLDADSDYSNLSDCERDESIYDEFLEKVRGLISDDKQAWLRILKKFNYSSEDIQVEDIMDSVYDDLFGSSEFYWTRVLENFEVLYVPEEIVIDDVTLHFA